MSLRFLFGREVPRVPEDFTILMNTSLVAGTPEWYRIHRALGEVFNYPKGLSSDIQLGFPAIS